VRHICHPDTPNAEPIGFGARIYLLPEWFIQLLWEAIGVSGEYGYIARLGFRVIEWNVLFYSQMQYIFLFVRSGCWIFSDMLAFYHMFHDAEGP
jgi:hypothetical protein